MESEERDNPRLLAIDDSMLIHRLLKARLRDERLEIHNATNRRSGLRLAGTLMPDVILLDLDATTFDGFAVLRELKADSRTHDIPVIMLAANADTPSKVHCFELGALDFVPKPFDVAELRARVRSAVRVHLLIKMLAKRAQVDAVTHLWNRSYLDQCLEQEIAKALRHSTPLALIMADLDHFKAINDRHGHQFGDHVLEEFARLIAGGRRGDIACRYGGEEFAIIAPHSTAEGAAIVADRYRDHLSKLHWSTDDEHLIVTASFGVTDLSRCADKTIVGMIASADWALYAAKHTGRDRVAIAPSRGQRAPVAMSA